MNIRTVIKKKLENEEFAKYLLKESVTELGKAIRGEIEYRSSNIIIRTAEEMLYDWIIGQIDKVTVIFMEEIYTQLQELFPYEGKLYRGIRIEEGATLYPTKMASFTSKKVVAFKFAGTNGFEADYEEEEGNKNPLFIETTGGGAFALDDLLVKLMELTDNDLFFLAMQDFVIEHEKIYPMTEELIMSYQNSSL